VAGAGSARSVVIMLTSRLVQRPVLFRCSMKRPGFHAPLGFVSLPVGGPLRDGLGIAVGDLRVLALPDAVIGYRQAE
jgi:hypothetical protein